MKATHKEKKIEVKFNTIFKFWVKTLKEKTPFKLNDNIGKNIYTLRYVESIISYNMVHGVLPMDMPNLLAWSFLKYSLYRINAASLSRKNNNLDRAIKHLDKAIKRAGKKQDEWMENHIESMEFRFKHDEISILKRKLETGKSKLSPNELKQALAIFDEMENKKILYLRKKKYLKSESILRKKKFVKSMLECEVRLFVNFSVIFCYQSQVNIYKRVADTHATNNKRNYTRQKSSKNTAKKTLPYENEREKQIASVRKTLTTKPQHIPSEYSLQEEYAASVQNLK